MKQLRLAVVAVLVAAGAVASAPAQTPADDGGQDVAALNAEAQQLDPADYPYVQAVCTVCHSPEMFLHNHSWEEWQGLFSDMISYGASGTDEQWAHIDQYFLKALTVINVNTAREDELMAVLQVDAPTAIRIVRRQPLRSIADLRSVPGVNADVIDDLDANSRLQF